MRRTISLIVAICLTAGGALAMAYLLLFPEGATNWMLVMSAFILLIGIGGIFLILIDA